MPVRSRAAGQLSDMRYVFVIYLKNLKTRIRENGKRGLDLKVNFQPTEDMELPVLIVTKKQN